MAWTLTGTYVHGDGTGRAGSLRFAPSVAIAGDDKVVLPAPLSVDLDSAGAFTVDLVGTDDVAYSPSGWVWSVEERMDGGRTFSFELTADSDISTLSTVAVPASYVTLVPTTRTIVAGAGLTGGGTLAADRTLNVGAGTGVSVAADAVSVVYGSAAGTAAEGNDARLSDARTPTAHATSHASAGSDPVTLAPSQITGTAVVTSDSRLSDARTPTAHAASHGSAGADPVTVAESQVTGLTAALAAKAPLASPALTGTPTAPTAAQGTATTQVATTAHVATEVGLLVPKALYDAHTILAANADNTPVALTVPAPSLVGRGLTGNIAALSAATVLADFGLAPLASPALTGTPTAPSATAATDSTQVATTAFVHDVVVVSRPNTDDYLVQVVQTVAGSTVTKTVFYDSGWRSIPYTSGVANWTAGTLFMRRINSIIYLEAFGVKMATIAACYALPTGFRMGSPASSPAFGIFRESVITGNPYWFGISGSFPSYGGPLVGTFSATYGFTGTVSYATNDAIPASLPGTLTTQAPA